MHRSLCRILCLASVAALAVPAELAAAPRIEGLELSQGTQFYKSAQHLNNAADYGPDNSVALVTGKEARARVYVSDSAPPATLTGQLTVERQTPTGWQQVGILTPQKAVQFTAPVSYTVARGNAARTLNFVISDSDVAGALRLTATVTRQGSSSQSAVQQWTLAPTIDRWLRIAAIAVGYSGLPTGGGSPINLPPPTVDNVRSTASMSLATFPVSAQVPYRIAGTIIQREPLLTRARVLGCPATWTELMKKIRQVRAADGSRPGWLYYGLLASRLPFKSSTVGCGGGGVGTGKTGWTWTMAHELGHAAGLPHVPGPQGCTPPSPDAGYLGYRPYRRGSIGEYGFDLRSDQVKSPRTHLDLMQYCSPVWISPYNYVKLVNSPRLQVSDQLQTTPFSPVFHVVGALSAGGSLDGMRVLRLLSTANPLGEPLRDTVAELADPQGRVIASAPVHAVSQAHGGVGCPCIIEAAIADHPAASSVRIRSGPKILWSVASAPAAHAPLRLTAARQGARIAVSWRVPATAGDVWLRQSDDGGRTWTVLIAGTRARSLTVPPSRAGSRIFELLVPTGFDTIRATATEP